MNSIDNPVWEHYVNHVVPQTLSDGARWHYQRKLRFLADETVARHTWKGINFLLERHNIDLFGKRVLDIGAGTGFTSIYFAAAGAREVVGFDASADKTEVFRAFLAQLPEVIREKIEVNHGRTSQIDYPGRFDLVFAQESISHIVDDKLFERVHAALSSGGVLYITDNNNVLCRSYEKEITDYWERTENGPVGGQGHHSVEWVYRDLRRDFIRQWFPVIENDEVETLADNTAYLFADSLREAVQRYLSTGELPEQRYQRGTPPIHPQWGYYMERVFNPYALKEQLLGIGFRKCVLYGGNGVFRPWYLRLLIGLIPLRVKYALRPHFAIIAIK